jgi:hypothetical protein
VDSKIGADQPQVIRAALQELAELVTERQEIGFLQTAVLPWYGNNVVDGSECDSRACRCGRFEIDNELAGAPPCEVAPGMVQPLQAKARLLNQEAALS